MSVTNSNTDTNAPTRRSPARRWLERGVAGLLGILLTFGLLEIGLRVYGKDHQNNQAPLRLIGDSADDVLLCVGDSFTEGLGANPGASYPHQLHSQLEADGGPAVQVVNAGLSGQNSYELLVQLDRQLDKVDPDYVLVLTGSGNTWKYFGYRAEQNENRIRTAVRDMVHQTATVRLYNLATESLPKLFSEQRYQRALTAVSGQQDAGSDRAHHQDAPRDATPERHREVERGNTPQPNARIALAPSSPEQRERNAQGLAALAGGDAAEAKEIFWSLLDERPTDAEILIHQAHACQALGEREEAEMWAERALMSTGRHDIDVLLETARIRIALGRAWGARIDLATAETLNSDRPEHIDALAQCFEALRDHERATRHLEALLQLREDPALYHRLARLARLMEQPERALAWEALAPAGSAPSAEQLELPTAVPTVVEQWLRSDLNRIIDKIHSSGAIPILQTYPNHYISDVVRSVAEQREVILVDHEASFRVLPNQRSYFVEDGHCNDRGYGVMAATLAEVVRGAKRDGDR